MLAVLLIFVLGVANFTLHKAVMESGHPLIQQTMRLAAPQIRQIFFAVEFGVLLTAMLLTANGWPSLAWAYVVYSSANGVVAWWILSGRV